MLFKLKRTFKLALSSGKIYYTGTRRDRHFDYNFEEFAKVLSDDEWSAFENKEKQYRANIASSRINHGVFICKGNVQLWINILKLLSGIFFCHKVFLYKQRSGVQWSVNFLRYVVRVLKTFPRDDHYRPSEQIPLIEYIEAQLNYANKTIRPFFSLKGVIGHEHEMVAKQKLTFLWLHKRKKAIAVIRNGGKWPSIQNENTCVDEIEAFFNGSPKFSLSTCFEATNHSSFFDRSSVVASIRKEHWFTWREVYDVASSCPRGKSCGLDGVFYEDIKISLDSHESTLVQILNTMLINQRISSHWKHCIIQRIPKKDFDPNDQTTLRDISLLPTCYKILSKLICKRMEHYVSTTIDFWQRAFLKKRDRQELIFSLKSVIDDFRHLSTILNIAFIDFSDAFGSIRHEFIFETLLQLNIPDRYCCLVEDLYKYSSFQVICGFKLSSPFYILRGTKTGDPLSALLFILVIDRVCKPMVSSALVSLNLQDERDIKPFPVQAYADDIATISYDADLLQNMFIASEEIMNVAGLEIKPSKCAVLSARRSGNNWYRSKNAVAPDILVQSKVLPSFGRNHSYKYLGKSLSLSGEDPTQIKEIIETYENLLQQISACSLPLSLKSSALNNLALAKILHHFYNTRFSEKQLIRLDKMLSDTVRSMYGLYATTTLHAIYLPRECGGIGVKRLSDVYYSTRVSFLIKMLNHPVEHFRQLSRASLKLHMHKRGVVYAANGEENFLGYRLNSDGFLLTSNTFGCQSDWLDMLRYCRKLGVKAVFSGDSAKVFVNGQFLDYSCDLAKLLFLETVRINRIKAGLLSLQGPFLRMNNIQLKASHSILYNWKVDDDLVRFVVKARLSILPTNFTLHIWNRERAPLCPFCQQHTESIAHLFNGCNTFRNFYSRRHHRIVQGIAREISSTQRRLRVVSDMFVESIFPELPELRELPHRRPDILVIDPIGKKITIVEITVCFDVYFERASKEKLRRYEPLNDCLRANGWDSRLIVLCFGSLGSVKDDVWKSLRSLSIKKDDLKSLLSWCSISACIMANYIWRHRVRKLFRSPSKTQTV